jgi:hypothetical protein
MVANLCFQGSVPLISVDGLHQLHIFIFFLAVFHVVYSAITMMLGKLKVGSTFWVSIMVLFFSFLSLEV